MRLYASLLVIFLFLFLETTIAAKKSYVVYMGAHLHGQQISEYDLHQVTQSHYHFLASYLGSHNDAKEAIFYSYTRHINGFAAILEEEVASTIANHPDVISVFANEGKKLHTTRSWTFLGLEEDDGHVPAHSMWEKATFGEDTIIANFDTGVWPESKSFGDEGIGPIPSRWKGICQNNTKVGVHCNRKLIGARYFNKGYLAALASSNTSTRPDVSSPRDYDGHGSHTLSTAGGSFVRDASVFGYGKGVAKGGSPKARVATYKVCWTPLNGNECFDSDILAAFDAAIADGVDVISASLGGSPNTPYFDDSLSIGSFHAIRNNIIVVCSAGNSGPNDHTVVNVSPWLFTVAASTMDRDFSNWLLLPNGQHIKGESLAPKSLPAGKYYPLVDATQVKATNASIKEAKLCKSGTLDPKKAKGKIIVCLRGDNARVDKGEQVALVGGVGMVLANDPSNANEVIADPHVLPASHITYNDGVLVYSYINTSTNPKASITHTITKIEVKPAPFMAAFSSKGPNLVTPDILKPDITAPGVSVIAAYTEAQGPTNQKFDRRRVKFNSVSGTSMSCPHISGVVGLLKTLYPDWTPAAIKSALMTTATVINNVHVPITNASRVEANPFHYGAGHVNPNSAMDPGLIYDMTFKDHLNFLCALNYNKTTISLFSKTPYVCPNKFNILNLNYPSITIPNLNKSITISRTLKNVGSPAKYIAHIQNPRGISILIRPCMLEFKAKNEENTYHLTIKVNKGHVSKDYVFGRIVWSDGVHYVASPITVRSIQ